MSFHVVVTGNDINSCQADKHIVILESLPLLPAAAAAASAAAASAAAVVAAAAAVRAGQPGHLLLHWKPGG
jgi:hypothetical protein